MKNLPIEFDSDIFSCTQKDEFAILTLKENPLKIATSLSVKEQLFSTFSAVEESPGIRGLLLINSIQYSGDVEFIEFLKELIYSEPSVGKERTIQKLQAMHSQIMNIILNFYKPIVAGMLGNIESFFMGICLFAEYRIATPDTKLVRINSKLGLPPDGVLAFYMMQNLGRAKTIDIFLSKSSMNATEAYDFGLLTEIVPENELQNKCLEKLEKICELPSHAISATRRLIQPQLNILDDYIKKSYEAYWTDFKIMQQKSE